MTDAEHKAVFTWPDTTPANVVLTGSFDNWSSSVTMTKTDSGFETTVALPWDAEVVYKYVVDGQWLVNDQQPKKDDGHGQLNNVYCSPKAPEPSAVVDAPTAAPEVQSETGAAPAALSETEKPIPEVKAEDQLGKAAETAPVALPPLVDIVPLASEVQHATDAVPEATVGPTAAAPTAEPEDVKPATSLPIVEVLPSQDALPETAPVEGATTANESAKAAVEATPTPAIDGKPVPESTAAVEAAPAPATSTELAPESISPAEVALAPAPGAEVVPDSAPAVEATPVSVPSTDIVPESTPAVEAVPAPSAEIVPAAVAESTPTPAVEATSEKADEAAPAVATVTTEPKTATSESPAVVVSDAVTVPVSDSTAAKVDAVAAPTESTTEKPAESVAVPETEGQPVATTSTPEANLRSNGSVNDKADRRSRTLSALKGKLFPTVENEEANGTPTEDDTTQKAAPPSPTKPEANTPPREKRKSFFGRMASIFKPSS